jgi:uncharacterized protein YjbJ (UPF0337 family)
MSFDFSSIDFEAGDVASDIDVDSASDAYGSETLADSSDQVGDFAGDSDFVNATDPSNITDAPTDVPGSDVANLEQAGPPAPSAVDSLKDQAGALADKAKDAASGALDKIKAQASSTLTKLESQFTAKNIEAFATKTAKSLITQVENTAINVAKNAANQALSTVVGPAVASTLTNGVTRSLTGPATVTPKTVSPTSNPTVPTGYQNESQQAADGNGGPVDPNNDPGAVTPEQQNTRSVSDSQVDNSAGNVGYVTGQDPENGTYYVKNEKTGQIVASGLTEQSATLRAQDQTFIDAGDVPAGTNTGRDAVNYNAAGTVADPNLATQPANADGASSITAAAANNAAVADPNLALPPLNTGAVSGSIAAAANAALNDAAARTQGLIRQAQNQQTARVQNQNKAQATDWRVRLSLAPTSNYLYNAPDCGPVLWPLYNTNGVIFPYTPAIDTGYKANYTPYDLTHSNYRGYFYQNSYIDGINIKAVFTAQDTAEADYLLAVIHFFRSVTKMFYGQDAERGTPPPLVFLSGLGDFQFNQHPCVVSQFNYNLPADVNYIRAQSVPNNGTNQLAARNRQTTLGNPVSNAIQRLASLGQGIRPGALTAPFAPQGSLGANNPTYVPTKMDISLTLLPIQSRQQVSQQFSLRGFANGNLLKGGFW